MSLQADAEKLFSEAVRSFESGQPERGVEQVDAFLAAYPADERAVALRVLRLSGWFDAGRYSEVLERAPVLLPELAGEECEAVQYLYAAAYCLSQDYVKALEQVAQSEAQWPAGRFQNDLAYFKAVSLARLGYYAQAKALLLPMQAEKVVDFAYLDAAMYELALIEFHERDYRACAERLGELNKWVTDESLEVQVQLLLGRSLAAVREREKAAEYLQEALKLTRDYELSDLQQEVLFHLVDFYGRERVAGEKNAELERAIPYYAEFMERFPDSVYAAQVVTAALPALFARGELEKGLQQLDSIVRAYCAQQRAEGLRAAVQQLVWKRLKAGVAMQDLRKELCALPQDSYAAVQWFALIHVYQTGKKQSVTKWGQQLRFETMVDEAYAHLVQIVENDEVAFVPAYLRNAVGWWLLEAGAVERAAVQFSAAQDSSILAQREEAVVGEAAARRLAQSVERGALKVCRETLDGVVVRTSAQPKVREMATYQLCEVLNQLEDWGALSLLCGKYIYDENWTAKRARVYLLEGIGHQNQGNMNEAIAVYTRVFANFMQKIEVTAEVVDRMTQLTWQRNGQGAPGEPKDRQVAYQLAHRFLSVAEELPLWRREQPEVQRALQSIETNVDAWEASGEVSTVEELLEALHKKRRGIR